MRSNIFSMKALRLALLSMFVTSTIIGVNSCRDEFDEKEALELEHAFLLQLQQQRDDARRQALLDSIQAAQAAAQQAAADRRAEMELEAQLQAQRDALFLKGGSINYAVNVVDGNSTTFSNNGRTSSEDMSGFVVTVFHQELGTLNTGTTDASGMVVFPDLRIGKVTVNVLKPGFTPANFVADITPSSPFEKPTAVGGTNTTGGSPAGDPNGYVRSAGTVIPVFEIELGNVFDGTQSVPTAELNRYSTVSGKMNIETDLTDFDREVAPQGTLISLSIDSDDPTFLEVVNRATNNTFGSTDGNSDGTASENNTNTPGEGNNFADGAEGDGRIIQLTYSDATFTGVTNANGEYTVIVPSFPTGSGLPMVVQHSSIAADQTLYDVVSRENNEAAGAAVYGVVTKRTVFGAGVAAGQQSTIPDFDAVDVSVDHPLVNSDGQGASAKAYIDDADGGIAKVVMINGGHNYYAAPYVIFTRGGQGALDGYDRQELLAAFEDPTSPVYDDDQARGTATVENGVVTGVTITNVGAGYTAETVGITFIPRGNAPTFSATISAGGGCIPAGTTWTISGGFTQVPNLAPSSTRMNGNYTATVAGGTVTITSTAEVCGFTPSQTVTFTATSSKVTSMMKLRPTIALEGGSIGPLTIAEGTYNAAPASTAVVTNDVVGGATTDEQVLNGLYSQAPLIKISGAGTGASATATLTNGKVSDITVVGGSGYDRANTNILVESSVQDANGNPTLASFLAKFVPVGGASTLEATATTPVNAGTFYTLAQFTAFNADNSANDLVRLDARYNLNGTTSTIAATTQSNTALTVTPAGTPLNVQYSMNDGTGSRTGTGIPGATTVDADDNDKLTGEVATPGVNFTNGGQGYSEDSDIMITATDPNNTRKTQAQSNAAQPVPGDFFDQAQFDYQLAEGYVTEVTFTSNASVPSTQGPLGIVVGRLPNGLTYDSNGDGTNDITVAGGTTSATAANSAGAGTELDANGIPLATVDVNGTAPGGSFSNIEPGQLDISTPASGTGIQALRPVAGSIGGRFAQTPELQITGPGTGFEYRFVMDFEHAIQPVLAPFIVANYPIYLEDDFGTVGTAPYTAGATITVRFRDVQTGATAPGTPAQFQARFVVQAAAANVDGDGAANDMQLNYVTGTFSGLNNGGAGYNPVNIRTMVLQAFEATDGTATDAIPATGVQRQIPRLNVENGDGTVDETIAGAGGTMSDFDVEGLSSVTLGGRIVEIVADNGRVGTGYAAHPTNTYTIVPTGYSENVPTSAEIGAVTTSPGTNGIQFTSGSGLTGTVISTGDGFPYIPGVDNKQFIRLLRRDGTFVDRADIAEIKVARRIGYIRFQQVPAAVTQVFPMFDATLTGGVPAGGTGTAVNNNAAGANALKAGQIFYTGRVGQAGATTATAGKTVAVVDEDNDGDGDYFAFVGNGYGTESINLSIMARNFSGGATGDEAVASVRSSGLAIGSVTINTGVVHPTVATRANGGDPTLSTQAEPSFRLVFGAPAGTPSFGTATTAPVNNSPTYNYRSITENNVSYELNSVEITSGGANYTAAPFFRLTPRDKTQIASTANGEAAVAGGAVTGVTVNTAGNYSRNAAGTLAEILPNVTLNDYLRKLYLREEGLASTRLKLNGVGTVAGVIVDNAGSGYDAVGTNGSVVPNLMVVSKGNDFDDKNNDGIFQNGEHRGTQATVVINAGADLANLTAADFTVTNAGDGYTQDPDIVVWTHNNEFVALPRVDDNPVIVERTAAADAIASFRGFVVENNSATNFAEQPFTLADAGPDNVVDATAAWAGAANQGPRTILVTAAGGVNGLSENISYSFGSNNRNATARTNEGVISAISVVTSGDNLLPGTYPLVIYGGGQSVTTHASATVTIADGVATTAGVTLTNGGAGYDDSALNPGPDGVFDPASTFSNGTTPAVPAAGSDDFVGVRVVMLLGDGASAEAIPDAINVGSVEITDGGAGYNDEPFSVRFVPQGADLAGQTEAAYLANPSVVPNIIEAKASNVTVNATTGAIEAITVDPANPGYGYTVAPKVVIENFRTILMREAEQAYNAGNFDQQFPIPAGGTFAGDVFDRFVTAGVVVEVDGTTGGISKAEISNPGFGYITGAPVLRVQGIGKDAVLTAAATDLTNGQTGVSDFGMGYFVGGGAPATINFANHRLESVTVTTPGSGYFGGNFPRTAQGFQATLGNGAAFDVDVPAGTNLIHDIYYGTGNRNASEVNDNGSNARQSAGDNQ